MPLSKYPPKAPINSDGRSRFLIVVTSDAQRCANGTELLTEFAVERA
jgi:hypothetical protein